jgi:hypothetical protein
MSEVFDPVEESRRWTAELRSEVEKIESVAAYLRDLAERAEKAGRIVADDDRADR